MVFNAMFNNISVTSWRTVLLVEETGVPGENHLPVASHWLTLSHIAASSIPRHERFIIREETSNYFTQNDIKKNVFIMDNLIYFQRI